MNHTEELQQQIAEYRKEVTARRARAFIDCPDYLFKHELKPLTPKTWTMLHASGNRFLCGGMPLEGDIRNYIWYSSPWFTMEGRFIKNRKWASLLWWNTILHSRKDEDWYVATLALAGAEIAGIVHETLADAPTGGKNTSPGPCLEAQFIHLCAVEYGWAPEYTREQPLKKLFQLRRNFDTTEDDEGERQIRFAHLRKINEEIRLEREKSATVAATE